MRVFALVFLAACGGTSYDGYDLGSNYSVEAETALTDVAPSYGPIVPGLGERTVVGAAADEIGSWYIWATSGAAALTVGHSQTACRPNEPDNCRLIPKCATLVETRICSFSALDAEPHGCVPVTLAADQQVTVPVTSPYAGVQIVDGVCLAADRLPDPLQPGTQWWRQADQNHQRGWIVDMAAGGGSPPLEPRRGTRDQSAARADLPLLCTDAYGRSGRSPGPRMERGESSWR